MRVGLLSDIHANLVALEAVLASLGKVDALWVTGDTVGYGPDPGDTLALLRERGALLVQGNHDRAVATGEGLEFFHDRLKIATRSPRSRPSRRPTASPYATAVSAIRSGNT